MTTTTNTTHKKIIHCDKHFIKQKHIKNLMIKSKKKELTLNVKGYCESDFARCNDTSESVCGVVINFCGAETKRQRTVLLSSTEADSEVAADITANEKNYPIETTAIITGVDHMKNDTIGQFELKR